MMLGQHIINAILRPLCALLVPYDVEAQQNLPGQGPVLVMINHINLLDVVMPGMFLPRDVVMLSCLVGLSHAEIGEQTGMSPESVRTHLHRGLARLALLVEGSAGTR